MFNIFLLIDDYKNRKIADKNNAEHCMKRSTNYRNIGVMLFASLNGLLFIA